MYDLWVEGDVFELMFLCELGGVMLVSVGVLKVVNGGCWSAFGTSWYCVIGWSRLGLDF